jgi:hypothetical protein
MICYCVCSHLEIGCCSSYPLKSSDLLHKNAWHLPLLLLEDTYIHIQILFSICCILQKTIYTCKMEPHIREGALEEPQSQEKDENDTI